MSVAPWKVISSEYVVRNEWFQLRADNCVNASGVSINPYYILEYPDFVNIIAIDSQKRVLVLEQYRHGAERVCLELPGGVIDDSEMPQEAAQRELLEETGAEAETWIAGPPLYVDPSRQNNREHSFLALGAAKVTVPNLDHSEEIVSRFMPVEQLLESIDEGAFVHSTQVASLFWAFRHYQSITGESLGL